MYLHSFEYLLHSRFRSHKNLAYVSLIKNIAKHWDFKLYPQNAQLKMYGKVIAIHEHVLGGFYETKLRELGFISINLIQELKFLVNERCTKHYSY